MIEEMRENYTVTELCDALEVSRSGYYKSIRTEPSERMKENQRIIDEMKRIHRERFKNAYGSPRMTVELQKRGFTCSENRVARLMAEEGLKARHKTAFRPKTTIQDPDRAPAPNRLADIEAPARSGEVFVSDITYVATREGWLYLAVTMDLYSRRIEGWHLADSMKTDLVIKAAQKAMAGTEACSGAIFHSDRGCQYTSQQMRAWLSQRGMLSSMSAAGYCYDNATCESLFATLKREAFPTGCVFDSKSEARLTIFEYLETFYNRERIHTSLGNQSPESFLTNHFQPSLITLN
jgi:transposase InsO family protein